MARTTLTPTDSSPGGLEIGTGATALEAANVDGNALPGDGSVQLIVFNGDASPSTVTILTPGTIDGNAIAEIAQAVPAGEYWLFGPYNVKSAYVQAADGLIHIDYSSITSMEVGAIRVRT